MVFKIKFEYKDSDGCMVSIIVPDISVIVLIPIICV